MPVKIPRSIAAAAVSLVLVASAWAHPEVSSVASDPAMKNVVEIAAKIRAQIAEQTKEATWGVGVYKKINRNNLEYNPDNLDPYVKWLVNPNSKADMYSYSKLELVEGWVGEAPQFVNAARLHPPANGMYNPPNESYSFPNSICDLYVIVFKGGSESENFVIKPINVWESVFGVRDMSSVQTIHGVQLPGTKYMLSSSDLPLLKSLLEAGLNDAKAKAGKQ